MKEEKFLFSNCTFMNNELFFVEIQSGLLAKMHPINGDIAYCDEMEGYIIKFGDVIDFISSYQGKIYALETSGKNLVIFDLANSRCQYRELNCCYQAWGNFAAFERYGSFYYIFPRHEKKVFRVNTNDYEITEVVHGLNGIDKPQCCCRTGNTIWIVPENGEVIGEYHLADGKMKVYGLKAVIENAVDTVFMNGNLYILNQFGLIYRWDTEQKEVQKITAMETEHLVEKSVCRMISAGNKLIVFPSLGEDIRILDLVTGEMEIYQDYPADFCYQELRWSKYYRNCEDENYYYLAMRSGNYLLKVCKADGRLLWIKPAIPSREEKMKIRNPLMEKKIYSYASSGNLIFNESDVEIVSLAKTALVRDHMKSKDCIGKKIYERIKRTDEF